MMFYSSSVINNTYCSLFKDSINMEFNRFSQVRKDICEYQQNVTLCYVKTVFL